MIARLSCFRRDTRVCFITVELCEVAPESISVFDIHSCAPLRTVSTVLEYYSASNIILSLIYGTTSRFCDLFYASRRILSISN